MRVEHSLDNVMSVLDKKRATMGLDLRLGNWV